MRNVLKSILFSVVAISFFLVPVLFSYNMRDKKYFSDKGTIAYEEKSFNFFYGVYGYHSKEPILEISNDSFDFRMYEILAVSKENTRNLTEYVYIMFIPKDNLKSNEPKLVFDKEDETSDSAALYQYMNFNLYNAYDDIFLISKETFIENDYVKMTIKDGEDDLYSDSFKFPEDKFKIKDEVNAFYEEYNKNPGLELVDKDIYPQTTHVASGYSYIIWLGILVGLLLILALYGGVYLKPPFQKGKGDPSPAMKKDKHKYL